MIVIVNANMNMSVRVRVNMRDVSFPTFLAVRCGIGGRGLEHRDGLVRRRLRSRSRV